MRLPSFSLWALLPLLVSCVLAKQVAEKTAFRSASSIPSGVLPLPDATKDGIEAVRKWSYTDLLAEAEENFDSHGVARAWSPSSWEGWQKGTFYRIALEHSISDEDDDGEDKDLAEAKARAPAPVTSSNLHGWTLKDIKGRLNYLVDLGVTTLSLGPVLQSTSSSADCISDPLKVESSIGTDEDLRDLIKECHHRSIRVVMEISINQLCDEGGTTYTKEPQSKECFESMKKSDWEGSDFENPFTGDLYFAEAFFPPLRSPELFSRCGRPDGEGSDGASGALYGDVRPGSFRFKTGHKDLQAVYTNLMKYWIAFADVDGFSLRDAENATLDYLAHFSSEVRAYAKTLGKPFFPVLGQVASASSSSESSWQAVAVARMSLNESDWGHTLAVPASLTNRLQDLRPVFEENDAYPLPGLNGLHDMSNGKIGHLHLVARGVWGYENSYQRNIVYADALPESPLNLLSDLSGTSLGSWLADAMVLLLGNDASVINAGAEQGLLEKTSETASMLSWPFFSSASSSVDPSVPSSPYQSPPSSPDEAPSSSPDLVESTVLSIVPEVTAAIANASAQGQMRLRSNWRADPLLRRGHALYRLCRGVNALRRTCKSLQHGALTVRHMPGSGKGDAYLAFSRALQTNEHVNAEMVVMVSHQENSIPVRQVEVNASLDAEDGSRFVNVFNPSEIANFTRSGGKAYLDFGEDFELSSDRPTLFALESILIPYDEVYGVALCYTGDLTSERLTPLEFQRSATNGDGA